MFSNENPGCLKEIPVLLTSSELIRFQEELFSMLLNITFLPEHSNP